MTVWYERNGVRLPDSESPEPGDMRVTEDGGSVLRELVSNNAASPYAVYSPVEFLDTLPDTVEAEFWDILTGGGADGATATRWFERAKLRGRVDFNEAGNRQGMAWLIARTSLDAATADQIMAGG